MLNSQQQPLTSNENRSTLHRNREQDNDFRREMNNRTRTLTTQVHQWHTQIQLTGPLILHIACLKHLTPIMEIITSHTTLTGQLKIEDTHITPQHLDKGTHHMKSKAFTTEDNPCQMALYGTFHMGTTIMTYTILIRPQITWKQCHLGKQRAQFIRAICYYLLS